MSFFGRKEKPPYKIPHEVIFLRGRIDSELRENFPNINQYQELVKEAEAVFRELNAVIRTKDHAEEASRLRDDLKARLRRLADKIKQNRSEADSATREDFNEDEIDSLRRKTLRNNAKSVFTDLLKQMESLKTALLGGQVGQGRSVDSIAMDIVRTVTSLNDSFLKQHAEDREIADLKREVLQLTDQLNRFLDQHRTTISQNRLETKTVMAVMKITTAVNLISL